MNDLVVHAERIAAALKARKETVAVAESAAGGLITAALLAVPGASATWGIGETGAAGPTGNRYGDPAGHAWVAVSGPRERAVRVNTGATERMGNMQAFAAAALRLLQESL